MARIPKKLYYLWMGNKEKPEIFNKCLNSWKQNIPDYEIVEINEKNFDIEYHLKKNRFFRECYERELWAYVGDYARAVFLYENGGVYADIDMEILKNFDVLLPEGKTDFFITYESIDGIGPSFFAAEKKSIVLEKLIELYEDEIWKIPLFTQPALIKYIFQEKFKYKLFEGEIRDTEKGIYILKKEHFFPFLPNEKFSEDMITDETYGIHWWFHSWKGLRPFLFLKTKHLKGYRKVLKKTGIYLQMARDFLRNKK